MRLNIIIAILVLQTIFVFGYWKESLQAAFKAGADSVPKAVPAKEVKDPAQWWFGVDDKFKAKARLCGKS